MVRDREFYKTIFRIALPSALQALITFFVVLADDMMVAALPTGEIPQAAVSQINAITALFTATILGFASGSSVLIAQYWGKRDTERIKRVFSIVTLLGVAISILFFLVARLAPDWVASIVVSSDKPEVVRLAKEYLVIACFSYIPFAISYSLIGMLRAVEVVRVTLYTSIAALIVNVSLNYVLIFGHFGFPAMGVAGAALATVISRVVEMLIVLWYAFYKQKVLDLKPRDLLRFDGVLVRDYIRYGVPVGLTDAQWALIGMFKAMIIGKLATEFISANSITTAMMNLGTMFTFALAGGASVVVGKVVGAGDYTKARAYSNTIQIMFAIIGVFMAAVVFLLAKPFVSLYGSAAESPAVRELAVTMIYIGAVTLIGTSYHASCFVGINRGAGDSRFVALVDMICGWFIVLPATFLAAIVFRAPLPVVFLMTRIDQCFKWIIAFFRLRGDKWIRNVTRG
ncbi:MAG: MATE family efflux transporter [Christensenellales bacterium]|jgi:putative MATE family efflux protein